jgi:UDP-N-acetyl-D-mannosaminuronic acid dehydrogenase
MVLKNLDVVAYDKNNDSVSLINQGKMPFLEEGGVDALAFALASGKLVATSDPTVLSQCEALVFVMGTPVDEFLNPNPNEVVDTCLQFLSFMKENQLIILRSTLYPGVTRKIEAEFQNRGMSVDVAYCPERILEGHALKEISSLPQIIGTSNQRSFERARSIFEKITPEQIQCTPEEAELAKLFTNVWRYSKFAVANQFWMISNDLGVDFARVREVITKNYPRAQDLPTPGFTAGPCLFKDTMQLNATLNHGFPLGHAAMLINEGVPHYIVQRLQQNFDLSQMNVGILGASFKADVDDIRGSLAFKLRRLLQFYSKLVLMTDPYVQDERLMSLEYLIENSDLLIVATPHRIYSDLSTNKPVIDIWNMRGKGIII